MKHYLLAAGLLLATPIVLHAQDKDPKPSLKALDEKNGFRTHHFGDDISLFPTAALKEDDKDTKYYTLTDESLKIGGADIKQIVYGFYKGKLQTISIETTGYTNSKALFDALKAQYGSPYQSNQYIEKYNWFGKVVSMTYDENSINHSADVFMMNKPMVLQEQEDQKAAAKKAGSDL